MRALLVWVALMVVFDAGVFVAVRQVIQPGPVLANVSDTAVQRDAVMEPTLQATTCRNAVVQDDPKTLDQMCDVMSMACDQETYARMCPPLSDPQRDGK